MVLDDVPYDIWDPHHPLLGLKTLVSDMILSQQVFSYVPLSFPSGGGVARAG